MISNINVSKSESYNPKDKEGGIFKVVEKKKLLDVNVILVRDKICKW